MIHKRAVTKALKAARVKWTESGKLVFISCPFHKEEIGSLAIYTNNDPVSWYCFGCAARGPWSVLADMLKLGELDSDWDDPHACRNLAQEIRDLIQVDPALPPNVRLWDYGPWRKFNSRTLVKARSLWWWDEMHRTRRIVWPVWDVNADLLGWVGRDLDDASAKRYYNMPHMEVTGTLWPWPRSLAYPEKVLILVEGITDALRLLQAGLPALATLGTTWNKTRSNLVANLGVERVVLAYDQDVAGTAFANRTAFWLIEASKLFGADALGRWEWSKGNDPGGAPDAEVAALFKEVMPSGAPHNIHPWLLMSPRIPQHWYSFGDAKRKREQRAYG